MLFNRDHCEPALSSCPSLPRLLPLHPLPPLSHSLTLRASRPRQQAPRRQQVPAQQISLGSQVSKSTTYLCRTASSSSAERRGFSSSISRAGRRASRPKRVEAMASARDPLAGGSRKERVECEPQISSTLAAEMGRGAEARVVRRWEDRRAARVL